MNITEILLVCVCLYVCVCVSACVCACACNIGGLACHHNPAIGITAPTRPCVISTILMSADPANELVPYLTTLTIFARATHTPIRLKRLLSTWILRTKLPCEEEAERHYTLHTTPAHPQLHPPQLPLLPQYHKPQSPSFISLHHL